MKINEKREITSIEMTREERLFAINLLEIAKNWAEFGFYHHSIDDVGHVLMDIISYCADNKNNNVIHRGDII